MTEHKSSRGFSLVELMMTLVIMTSLALISVPAVMQGLSRQAAASAATAVLNAVDFARVQASASNLAYGIVAIPTTGPSDNGTLRVYQGTTSACMGFLPPNPSVLMREIDFTKEFPDVRLTSTFPNNMVNSPLCIKPDGRVYSAAGDVTPTIVPAAGGSDMMAGTARINIQRFDENGNLEGVVHGVTIPFNGLARKFPR